MAIRLIDRYPNRANPANESYPHGSGRNKSSPTAIDGTPFDENRYNDHEGFFQSLLEAAEVTPNNTPDTVPDSQYADALSIVASGLVQIDVGGSTDTVLDYNQARVHGFRLTGILTGNIEVIVPDTERMYTVVNDTIGDFTVTVKTALGTGVVVSQGQTFVVRCDGVDVVRAMDSQRTIYVGSVAELASLPASALKNGTNVETTGFYSPADSGASRYIWSDNEDKANHNGITIIDITHVATPGDSGWYSSQNTGVGAFVRTSTKANLECAGVKKDGTDERVALTAAFLALDEIYGKGTIKAKNVNVTTPVSVIGKKNDFKLVFYSQGAQYSDNLVSIASSNVSFEATTFEGDYASIVALVDHDTSTAQIDDLHYKDCAFKKLEGDGIVNDIFLARVPVHGVNYKFDNCQFLDCHNTAVDVGVGQFSGGVYVTSAMYVGADLTAKIDMNKPITKGKIIDCDFIDITTRFYPAWSIADKQASVDADAIRFYDELKAETSCVIENCYFEKISARPVKGRFHCKDVIIDNCEGNFIEEFEPGVTIQLGFEISTGAIKNSRLWLGSADRRVIAFAIKDCENSVIENCHTDYGDFLVDQASRSGIKNCSSLGGCAQIYNGEGNYIDGYDRIGYAGDDGGTGAVWLRTLVSGVALSNPRVSNVFSRNGSVFLGLAVPGLIASNINLVWDSSAAMPQADRFPLNILSKTSMLYAQTLQGSKINNVRVDVDDNINPTNTSTDTVAAIFQLREGSTLDNASVYSKNLPDLFFIYCRDFASVGSLTSNCDVDGYPFLYLCRNFPISSFKMFGAGTGNIVLQDIASGVIFDSLYRHKDVPSDSNLFQTTAQSASVPNTSLYINSLFSPLLTGGVFSGAGVVNNRFTVNYS